MQGRIQVQSQFRLIYKNLSKISSKIPPKIGENPPQNLPKPSQNGSKIDPEGLLEPILDQCFEEVGF